MTCVSDHISAGKKLYYRDVDRLVAEAADKMNITGKRVLVIGTEMPWMETILLQRKPRSRNTININSFYVSFTEKESLLNIEK